MASAPETLLSVRCSCSGRSAECPETQQGGAPVSLTCPSNERRRLLASLERCGRRGIRFSESVGFLLTLLRRVLLLLSFFGFRRLVAHGAPPVVRVSNERIGCVQQYHLRHASGQRGCPSRRPDSRGITPTYRGASPAVGCRGWAAAWAPRCQPAPLSSGDGSRRTPDRWLFFPSIHPSLASL